MDLTQLIADVGGKAAVGAVAKRFGLNEDTVASAIDALLPAITKGIQSNVAKAGGAASLLSALTKGDHQKYLTQPESLLESGATSDGNGILAHVLGSKDVSRQVAGKAAEALGIDSGIVKQLLPVVASMAMGGLSKRQSDGGSDLLGELGGLLGGGGGGGGLGSLLGGLL